MDHNTLNCLCPRCHTWLMDKQIVNKFYKSCNSCGWAEQRVGQNVSLIPDDIGNGIDPIKGRPELVRPEDRNK